MSNVSFENIYQFDSLIQSLPSDPNFSNLIFNPHKNFTRSSKIGLINTACFILETGPTTLKNKLCSFYDYQDDFITPTKRCRSISC